MTTIHRAIRAFCSYSHRDEEFLKQLNVHLTVLKRRGLIDDWNDRKIGAGQEWREAIEENLKAADVVLLLVSDDFMASEFAYEEEMGRAIERDERGEALVIPIIVRPAIW